MKSLIENQLTIFFPSTTLESGLSDSEKFPETFYLKKTSLMRWESVID